MRFCLLSFQHAFIQTFASQQSWDPPKQFKTSHKFLHFEDTISALRVVIWGAKGITRKLIKNSQLPFLKTHRKFQGVTTIWNAQKHFRLTSFELQWKDLNSKFLAFDYVNFHGAVVVVVVRLRMQSIWKNVTPAVNRVQNDFKLSLEKNEFWDFKICFNGWLKGLKFVDIYVTHFFRFPLDSGTSE